MKKKCKNKYLLIKVIITIIVILSVIGIIIKKVTTKVDLTPEISRTLSYVDVKPGDEEIKDENNKKITALRFDAFFLKDKDGDGVAESIRGTCNEIGTDASLYMDLSILEEGYITDGTITINSKNFYFNTLIVKDNEVAANYISTNTKKIELNKIGQGTEKLLIGSVRSGDYSTSSTISSAIGNDTTKYSMENSVTFSGTFVDSSGTQRKFSKTIPFMVDWYGTVNCEITPKAQTVTTESFSKLLTKEGLILNFNINTTETKNQLIMAGNYISGTIPELNGYKPTSVKISGTNITYTYNEETREFTAQREATLDDRGIITSNAYTSIKSNASTTIRNNQYSFTVVYPIQAYEEMGTDITTFELAVPIESYNKGYNNSNEEDGFKNPYTSETATGIVVTTWKIKEAGNHSPEFNIYVGTYKAKPYKDYVISKNKPIKIYNGISLEETDDTYIVQWRAYTGTNGKTDGIVMKETTGKSDNFLNTAAKEISMQELTSNKGIYFTGATATLGSDGWIKVYDDDTNALVETFTSKEWSTYTASKPYTYNNKIKHIRIETSKTRELNTLNVYNIKELDDTAITEKFTRREFDDLSFIYSYLDGYMIAPSSSNEDEISYFYKDTKYNKALYESPTSVATIEINEDTISTQATAENQKITITTETIEYNEQEWKNGIFLVKIPSDIIFTKINSITTNNSNVNITAYDLYEENDNYFIKILTESGNEETFVITIDCNLTPDPRSPKKTTTVELYAINETASNYYYSKTDDYDIDGNLNKEEKVNYRTCALTLETGSSLNTTQIASNYGDGDHITLAPRVAKTDKGQRTAKITVSAINNYTYDIKDIKIQGVIPFKGNNYVISGRDLGSQFTTYMTEKGIVPVTPGVKAQIYYSTTENPTNDENDKSNGWTLAKDVKNWNDIKTYMIVIDDEYTLSTGDKIEFDYEINIPDGVDYNQITYSEHGIYFALDTNEGLFYTSTGTEKLGFMIAKQYDLEIAKYQKDTQKTLQGITFTLQEEGQDTSTIKVTDENGIINFTGLYVERHYILREQKTTEDYVLNTEEIRFYTYTKINEDGTESLYLKYENSEKDDVVYNAGTNTEQDYKIQIKVENDAKAKLSINKCSTTGEKLRNIKFSLSGEGKTNEVLSTDINGNVNVSGLYLNKEYTLEEIKASGYYVPNDPIKFTIINNNGTFELRYTDNGTTVTRNINIDNEIPTISLQLQNEKIPTYGLQLTKYAKGEEKLLPNAQYKIYGEQLGETGKIYTTDENGVLKIDDLYEYVEQNGSAKGGIKGEYSICEIFAPEGYALNSTILKFRAYRQNGHLKMEILEGQQVIRTITVEGSDEKVIDLNIQDAESNYPIIKIGVEDSQIFTLYKFSKDGITGKKTPIQGTKFVITDLEGNNVTGSDGNIIGKWDDTVKNYVLTTDENGLLTANITEGLYKAIEVYTDNKYIFDENEQNRTYYFGIGASQESTYEWVVDTVLGSGWNTINSVTSTRSGGIIAAGTFSEYIREGTENGVDLNKDGRIDEISNDSKDGIIVYYNSKGNYEWSKTIGGTDDDVINKIIQTSDGGYVIVGYTVSSTVKIDGREITELSRTESDTNLARRDGILIKLDSQGNYVWGIRLGGKGDDTIKSVIETSKKNLVIGGSYYENEFNFYETGNSKNIKASFETLGETDGFVASYSATGKYQWSQRIAGELDDEVIDITETSSGIVIAANCYTTAYLDTNQTVSQSGKSSLLVGYSLEGIYSWRYRFYANGNYTTRLSSITTNENDNIIAAVQYNNLLYGSKNAGTATTIINKATTNNIYDASLIEIAKDGTYQKLLYTLSGNYEDYISTVKATSDGGVAFGGWYYSDQGIDVDKDGNTTGEYDLPTTSGQYTSDSYVIKIDQDGQVKYSSRIYGEGYDTVLSIAQTREGKLIIGGSSSSRVLKATNIGYENDEIIGNGKSEEGFVIIEDVLMDADVPDAQILEVENQIKTYKITTEVKKHTETVSGNTMQVAGGDIDGEEGKYDGIQYSKDGIRYVETVNHGENSKNEIQIRPDPGYEISYITINGVKYSNFTVNEADGTVTLPIFENVTQDIHIIVEFSNTISSIEVNHYLWTVEEGITTQKVAESEYSTGNIGDPYTTSPLLDLDYEIITNADFYGAEHENAEDLYIPENHQGTYKAGEKQVINYYYKEKTYKLTVHHYLEGTNESVPLKGSLSGERVPDEITEGLKKGQEYTTNKAQENLIDYAIYELVEIPENHEGIIEQDTEVTYYYKIKTANLNITKVAEENHNITISNTEFALYELISEENKKDELINIKKVDPCWKLLDTYISDSEGIIKLEDLPITSEYRLVETKAADGRMIANGQWKIEFVYGEYDTSDDSIVNSNGTLLKVTAIGNPPALAITEQGDLLLPNKEYYKFPISGGFGINNFYQVGILVVIIGIMLLITRNIMITKKKHKHGKRKISHKKAKH